MSDSKQTVFDAIRNRTAVRKFSTAEISDKLIVELLDVTNRTPSGFNLQPWRFIIVRNKDLKKIMRVVAMNQAQVQDAPLVIVFLADTNAWRNYNEEIVVNSLAEGKMKPQQAKSYNRAVKWHFFIGPFGIFGIFKKVALLVRSLFKPTPHLLCSKHDVESYVSSQTMLAASTFMIAAKGAGLDTSPMQGFDEERMKKLLAVPDRFKIPLIIAVGYPLDPSTHVESYRTPLEKKVCIDLFTNKAIKLPR